ncbi:hypothetical protein JK636_14990 [Clostridium sp. YIM B02515]|uniref:Tetratricopeptide repeat protein n=1 Tax=Clostridium rhizosphaerae TaxID=2803861 RepID=A0ABS1TCH0_9CLOT|nr:hypothetical protein [Clostridium rhizosphaerae]MBL4937059.1 hypothetical protein [Clostridium rhizosphaerae]
MRIIKFILEIIVEFLIILTAFLISIFLNFKGSIIFSAAMLLACIFMLVIGIRGIAKNRKRNSGALKKFYNLCITAVILVACISFVESKNFKILNDNKSSSVYNVVRESMNSKKETEAYNKLFKTVKHNNAEIYYKEDIEPALDLVYFYLDKAETRTSSIFKNVENVPITIKFDYDKDVFKSINKDSSDYAGLYNYNNKTINIFVENCYSDILAFNLKNGNFKHYLLHEYSHYKFGQFLDKNKIERDSIPDWFNEGIAEYMAFGGERGNEPTSIVEFSKLKDIKDWNKYNNEKYTVYEQAHYAVNRLIALKGENAISQIILKTKESNFETAFKEASGVSLEEYQKQLQEDMNNKWKQYNKLIKPITLKDEDDNIRVKGLLAYADKNTNNIDPLLDAETIYSGMNRFDKAKEVCKLAVERNPNHSLAWARLGDNYVELLDFKAAQEAYEKAISVDKENSAKYISLSQGLLAVDINKAAETADKALKFDKSSFTAKEVQYIKNLKVAADKGNPYPAALSIIKNDYINSNTLKKAFINKLIKDFPSVKNASRSELEKIIEK